MPHVTTILGNEAGIQYQGVKDASSVLGVPLINGLIVGQFKRGRLDRPMTITLENIRGTLGHDPDNPDYIAVMDALSAGVPSVQVMRVLGENLVCTTTQYYAHGYGTFVSYDEQPPAYAPYPPVLGPAEHNELLQKVFNTIQASGDGRSLNIKKYDGELWQHIPLGPMDIEVQLASPDDSGYRHLFIFTSGNSESPPYANLQICAAEPLYLFPLLV